MSIILDTIEKINTKWNKKGFILIKTHHVQPRFFLAGMIYMTSYIAIYFVLSEFTNFFEWLFSPLRFLEPALKPFIEPDITLVGWIIVLVIFGIILLVFFAGLIPGIILVIKSSDIIDKEWPDNPDKTKKWRTKYAINKNNKNENP